MPFLVFAAALLPTLGLVPFNFQLVSTVADRYAYFALLGPALAVAMIAAQTARGWVTALAAAGVAGLAWLTVQRLPLWSEDLKLFAATLETNPRSWKAMHNYASALDDRGRTAEGGNRLTLADVVNDLAVMVWKLGRHDEGAASMRQSLAIRATPGTARNLAVMEEQLGNTTARDEALRLWQELAAQPAP